MLNVEFSLYENYFDPLFIILLLAEKWIVVKTWINLRTLCRAIFLGAVLRETLLEKKKALAVQAFSPCFVRYTMAALRCSFQEGC